MNKISFVTKIKSLVLGHKIISIIVIVVLMIGSYFLFFRNNKTEAEYITSKVSKGDIVVEVSGTGQIEASNTIDIKPKASGEITYVGVKVGDSVKKGTLIANIDSRDAKISLENAKISLAKLTKKPDTLTLLQKENSLSESYDNGWNTVSSYITDMNDIISGLEDIYGSSGYLGYKNISGLSSAGKLKVGLAEDGYYDASKSLGEINKLYKTLSRSSSRSDIDSLMNKSYESSKIIANAIKDTETAFNYVVTDLGYENNSDTSSTREEISSWMTSLNNYVNNLLSSLNSIKENNQSLSDIISGSDELDIRSAQLSLESKQNAYNDYFVRAPFDGIIASLTAKVGESSSSSIGTLITKDKIATIPLNEVDIAKIKLNQKASLSFDAISDLIVEGEVVEVDSVGTVSSGVVTYNIKVSLKTEDDRIKPGMSVSATIKTNEKNDVIVIPSSAIKTKNGKSYVSILEDGNTSPSSIEISVGISNDTLTEVLSGLQEGESMITKTITSSNSSSKTSTSSTPSILNTVSGSKMGGGMPRN